jgi:hypothetical protein
MTVEEMIALGFDRETAEQLAKTNASNSGGGLPFDTLKFNYDTKDILADAGIKKGEFISGYKINSKELKIEEEGKVLPQPLQFVVISSVYQKSVFDAKTNSTIHTTDIYYDVFNSKKQIDKKTKRTVEELEKAGVEFKFNNILLLLVKIDGEFVPMIHYMHGVNYSEFNRQLEELGIDKSSIPLNYEFTVESVKIPTDFNPAWAFKIVEARKRDLPEIAGNVGVTSEAIKKFTKWIDSVNSGETVNVNEEGEVASETTPKKEEAEVEINFAS